MKKQELTRAQILERLAQIDADLAEVNHLIHLTARTSTPAAEIRAKYQAFLKRHGRK